MHIQPYMHNTAIHTCYKHGAEHSQKRGISPPHDKWSAAEVFFSKETLKPTRLVAPKFPPHFGYVYGIISYFFLIT